MTAASPFTVLLVEDHEDSREAVRRWLEWKGWRVFAAGDRKSGVALGRKHPIDVLICDLQLPDGNGWQLMQQLNSARPLAGIMTSGHCAPSDIARSKAAGFLEHLIKPYPVEELDALLERIRRRLEKRPATAGQHKARPPDA